MTRFFSKKTIPFWVALFFLTVACQEEEQVQERQKYEGAKVVFENINTLYSEEANLKIKIEAPLETVLQNDDILYPKGIRVSMYDEKGLVTTTLISDSARYEKMRKLYHAFGNVEVINYERKQKVNADELHWDENKREFFTDTRIVITTPYENLYGIGMRSNDKFSKYKILKTTGSFVYQERTKGLSATDSVLKAESSAEKALRTQTEQPSRNIKQTEKDAPNLKMELNK
jgi:LPS export ABC transporter protein LptC